LKTALEKYDHEVLEWLRTDEKLIDAIISKECLTLTQLQSVTGSPDERGFRLLDTIKRSSVTTYNRFVQCVEQLRPNIATLLKGKAAGKGHSNDFT
jgi:hypothetical protein